IIVYAKFLFYRNFTDFITIPQLFQGSNILDLVSSILTLVKWYDIFLFLDVMLIWYFSKKKSPIGTYSRSRKVFALAMSLVLVAGNYFLAEMDRLQLFTRVF